MVIFIARNISRQCSLQISTNAHKLKSHHHHHHQNLFGKFTHDSTNAYLRQHSYKSYSSSSSSSSSSESRIKGGFLKWYLDMLQTRPFLTKGISSSLIFVAADVTSQIVTLPPYGSFDSFRTLRIAAYGLLIMGPSQHLWFNFLSRILPRTDVFTTVKKIFMGQAVYGPVMNSIFFSYNAALQGETSEEVVARLKRDLFPTLMKGLMYWPSCDFLTFRFIPVHLQPLVNSSFAYVWTIYLTYMASLKKVGEN